VIVNDDTNLKADEKD